MSDKGWLIPEPIEGNPETCLKMTLPNNRRYIAAVVGAIYQTAKWFNWQKSGQPGDTRATDTARVMQRYIYETLTIGDCAVLFSEYENQRSEAVFSGSTAFDDLLDLMRELDVKYRIDGELYEPVIDLVKCGCGDGSGGDSATSGGNIVQGGSEGGDYSGLTRVIDICANVSQIFITQIDDWIDSAQLLQYVPGLNLLNEGIEELLGVSLQELEAWEGESDSTDFILAFKQWVSQYFDDPFPGFQNREQLRTLTARLPLTKGGTLFMPIVRVWAEVADLQRLNASIKAVRGTASLNGECAALQRSYGREPYQPVPGQDKGYETIEYSSGNLRAYRFVINQNLVGESLPLAGLPAGEEIVTAASFNCYLTGQPGGFAEQQLRWLDTLDDTYKNLVRTTNGSSGEPGRWYEHTVTDPSVQPFLDELYAQFGNAGTRSQTAYTEPPGTSASAGLASDTALEVWDNPTPPASSPGTWVGEIFVITSYSV